MAKVRNDFAKEHHPNPRPSPGRPSEGQTCKTNYKFGATTTTTTTLYHITNMVYNKTNIFAQKCLLDLLQQMFGIDAVPQIISGDTLHIFVNETKATIDLVKLVSLVFHYY